MNFKVGGNHDSSVLLYPLTDHFPVHYMFRDKCLGIIRKVQFRLINEERKTAFINLVNGLDFSSVYRCEQLNAAFNDFLTKLLDAYNAAFPIKRKRVRNNLINAPWVTPQLKRCIKKKFLLFNFLRRGLIQKRQFNRYKSVLTWVINKIKRKYYHDKFRECKDFKRTWSNINLMLNRDGQETVQKIVDDDGRELAGVALLNHFNDYFTSVVSRLTENMHHVVDYNYFNNIQTVAQSCFFVPTDEGEVTAILQSMPNKGNSLLDIKPRLLLLISSTVVPVIVFLYNLGIANGLYPDPLKVGRIVPVFKAGEKTKVNNYRPISILTTINKIFEILTYKRMMVFAERHKILSHLQYGFMKGRNTTQAIFKVVSDILRTFHDKTYTIALFLDLTKAFDTVNRDILVHKLGLYGFRGNFNSFLASYLTNRQQFVYLSGQRSEVKSISSGVPQGSVLGPLLFNLFINDIVNVGIAEKVLFADDAVFYVTAKTLPLCIEKLKKLINELSDWLKNNKLVPNVTKTKLMMFTPRPTEMLPDIFFDGKRLEWVTDFKYLGVIIDGKLNFSLQAAEVYRKLSKMQGVFYSLSSLLPKPTLLTIYYSLVYPVVSQSIIIWGGVPVANIRNIKTTMNKILRSILKVKHDENNIPLMQTNEMYKSLNLLKYENIYEYFLLNFAHLVLYGSNDLFEEYLMPLLPHHQYNTRNIRINLPVIRLQVEKQSTVFQVCKLINELPEHLIVPQSRLSLKRKYREYAISRY